MTELTRLESTRGSSRRSFSEGLPGAGLTVADKRLNCRRLSITKLQIFANRKYYEKCRRFSATKRQKICDVLSCKLTTILLEQLTPSPAHNQPPTRQISCRVQQITLLHCFVLQAFRSLCACKRRCSSTARPRGKDRPVRKGT